MAPTINYVEPRDFKGLSADTPDLCTLELTVVTGLEDIAAEECRDKLGVTTLMEARGRVFIDINVADVSKVFSLRSIDNVNVVLGMNQEHRFAAQREDCFKQLYKLAEWPDWKKGMRVWQDVFNYAGDPVKEINPLKYDCCEPRPEVDLKYIKKTNKLLVHLPDSVKPIDQEEGDEVEKKGKKGKPEKKASKSDISEEMEQRKRKSTLDETKLEPTDIPEGGPRFRVSCNRNGNHKFGSPEAARQFGAGVNDMFGWPVNLTEFDLEILLYIDTEFVYVALCLTRKPLFKRNITNFGPTNLRSTICYSMMQLAKLKCGDVVVDPMCGGATIPMEGSLTQPGVLHLGGDNDGQAVKRSRDNINHLMKKGGSMVVDIAHWDTTRLPMRSQCVDAVVTDLPFGKRLGKKSDNRVLYYDALVELARVTKTRTGRAVLLTWDKGSMVKSLKRLGTLWRSAPSRTINVGGLAASIYILQRSSELNLSPSDAQGVGHMECS